MGGVHPRAVWEGPELFFTKRTGSVDGDPLEGDQRRLGCNRRRLKGDREHPLCQCDGFPPPPPIHCLVHRSEAPPPHLIGTHTVHQAHVPTPFTAGFWAGKACSDCDGGYFGSQCALQCAGGASAPCTGHGMCHMGRGGNGTCSCTLGFGGVACAQKCPGVALMC